MEEDKRPTQHHRPRSLLLVGAGMLLAGVLAVIVSTPPAQAPSIHRNITTTVFWVGEAADESNANIHNRSSTWIEDWVDAFGGVDDPDKRCGYAPCGFTPEENPFYFALPYSDLDESCQAKPSQKDVPWFNGPPGQGHSIIKNSWIKITINGKTAFAQWEDAGPFGEDDTAYVFNTAEPQARAGLDISPATATYLELDGEGQTNWEFVATEAVPGGPWRQTTTNSQPDCAR